jgi:hypothetical protein
LRFGLALGGVVGAILLGACGLELGGPAADVDGGSDASTGDGGGVDVMDVMTPDLGTGETESGACVCTDPLPDGTWTFVAYNGASRPTCPMQYGSPNDTLESPTAAATQCTCQCNGLQTQPTCTGDVAFAFGFGSSNQCNTRTGTVTCGSSCSAANAGGGGIGGDYQYLSFNGVVTPTGGGCNAPTVDASVPAATSQQGRSCALEGTTGTCGALACVPDPGAMYTLCIASSAIVTCPAGYPNAHATGTAIDDTRGCGPGPCTCALDRGSCSTPSVRSYWGSSTCSGNEWANGPRAANGACVATGYTGGAGDIESCQYTSTNSGAACAFNGAFAPDGGLALQNARTICCR